MPDIRSLYSDKMMEHFKDPWNVEEIENPEGIGHVGNPVCRDIMELYSKGENNIIAEAKFKAFGCGAAVATNSIVTESVKEKTIDKALKISNQAIAEALSGFRPINMHCSFLAEVALKSAIEDYPIKSKRRQKWKNSVR